MATKLWVGGDGGGATDWSVAANWSPVNVPVNGDDVIINGSSSNAITAGLDQHLVALASLRIEQSFVQAIGTASAYLQIGTGTLDIGEDYGATTAGTGSPRIKIDLGSTTTCAATIHNSSATATDTTKPPILLLMAKDADTLHVRKGKVGVALSPGETATLGTLNLSYVSSMLSDADVTLGRGVTWDAITKSGGNLIVQSEGSASATFTQSGGTSTITSGGSLFSIDNYGGTVTVNGACSIASTVNMVGGLGYFNNTGTIAGMICRGGTTDFTQNNAARTVTTLTMYAGATLRYNTALTITTLATDTNVSLATSRI